MKGPIAVMPDDCPSKTLPDQYATAGSMCYSWTDCRDAPHVARATPCPIHVLQLFPCQPAPGRAV